MTLALPSPVARYGVRFGRSRDLVGVDSLAEASAVVRRAVDAHLARGGGPSSFPRPTVLDGSTLRVVATVSWNGRVWPPGKWEPGTAPLYDPFPEAVREIEAQPLGPPREPGREPLQESPKRPSCEQPAEIPAAKETTMAKSKKKPTKKTAAAKTAAQAPAPSRERDPRLPEPGTVIERTYKGTTIKIEVLDRGFRYDGKEWPSATALAKHITGAKAISGPRFFGYDRSAEKEPATGKAK